MKAEPVGKRLVTWHWKHCYSIANQTAKDILQMTPETPKHWPFPPKKTRQGNDSLIKFMQTLAYNLIPLKYTFRKQVMIFKTSKTGI